jgi:phosphoglycolate phosphatase
MFELVIFDLDGTLLNTIDDICESLNLALSESGLPSVTIAECKYMVGSGVKVLIEKAVRGQNDKYDQVLNAYLYHYELLQKNKTRPYDGIIEVLKAIKAKDIKIAVLSNKPHEDTLRVVDHYFKGEIFDLVLGKKENNRPKPSTDGCVEILNTLKISGKVLYVGDTIIDMKTAKDAGFTSVAVTWGFRLKDELQDSNYMIDIPGDLIPIIEGNR